MIDSPVFFSGIGGSGMLPLASIVRAGGARVAGSDRSLDAGRTPHKFDYLRSLGIQLFPQDGSGLQDGMTLVTSAAVEATVPDVVRAKELGLQHLTRPEFLARLLNSAQRSVAVGGTSGKSTVTGMIGWILHACHRQPTVMNGAVMKNFVTPSAPFASALVGDPELFVSEVDESDGSIALYQPEIAVLTNISLDHKEMDELRQLFAAFPRTRRARRSSTSTIRRRGRSSETVPADKVIGYGFDSPGADFMGKDLQLLPDGVTFALEAEGARYEVRLAVPGRHNASNALGRDRGGAVARGPARGCGHRARPLRWPQAPAGDGRRSRRRHRHRRFRPQSRQDRGDAGDAARAARPAADHVPAARLRTAGQDGRPLAASLAEGMAPDDRLYLPDPVYQGGTVDKARGSDWLAEQVAGGRKHAEHIAERTKIGEALDAEARPGDRILIMGARDDTLIDFARELVERLAESAAV